MTLPDVLPLRELHRRSAHGIRVALLWSEETGDRNACPQAVAA